MSIALLLMLILTIVKMIYVLRERWHGTQMLYIPR